MALPDTPPSPAGSVTDEEDTETEEETDTEDNGSSGNAAGSPVAATPPPHTISGEPGAPAAVTPRTYQDTKPSSSAKRLKTEKGHIAQASTNLGEDFAAEKPHTGGKSKRRKRRKKPLKSKRSKSKRKKFPAYLYPKGECGAQSPRGIPPHYCGGRRNKSKKVHRRTRRTRKTRKTRTRRRHR